LVSFTVQKRRLKRTLIPFLRDKPIILQVPYDIPKSLTVSLSSVSMTNRRAPHMALNGPFGTTEINVRHIISTKYTYSDVRRILRRETESLVNFRTTAEISFDLSWQLTDPRISSKKTQYSDHSDFSKLSEPLSFSPNIQDEASEGHKAPSVGEPPASSVQADPEVLTRLGDLKDKGRVNYSAPTPQHNSSRAAGFEVDNEGSSRRYSGYDGTGYQINGFEVDNEGSSRRYSGYDGTGYQINGSIISYDECQRREGEQPEEYVSVSDPLTVTEMPEESLKSFDEMFLDQDYSSSRVRFKVEDDSIKETPTRKTSRNIEKDAYNGWFFKGDKWRPEQLPGADGQQEEGLKFQMNDANAPMTAGSRFSILAQGNEEEGKLAEATEVVERSSNQIRRGIQVLNDAFEASEDEPSAGKGPDAIMDTDKPVFMNPSQSPLRGRVEIENERPRRRGKSPQMESEDEEAQRQRIRERMDSPRIATVGKKSGRKSQSSPPRSGTNRDAPGWFKDYRKLSQRRVEQFYTQDSASRLEMPLPSAPPVSARQKEKPESNPLPRRKKGDTKRDRKEWVSD
jgi:hypothetical protein